MARYVKAQVNVSATLFSDGMVSFGFTYSYRENYLRKLSHTRDWRRLDGSCEPNDLPYVLWAELEGEV